jgi:magnesium-protoporphyrin IX monomethyl ester (oxidative) cyclase
MNKLKIEWDTPNGIRADTLDYNLLKKMKKSGCKKLVIALESGNQRVLDEIIKKNTKLDYLIEIAKYCRELRIKTGSFYVIGFPGETIEEMMETINLAIKLFDKYNLYPTLLIATPLYGTELYNICLQNGFIKAEPTPEELSLATQIDGNHLISTSDFSIDDIDRIVHIYEKMKRTAKIKKKIIYYINNPILAAKRIRDKCRNDKSSSDFY